MNDLNMVLLASD